jgi:hypothetical protein
VTGVDFRFYGDVDFCVGVPYYYLHMLLFTKLWCYADIGEYYVVAGDGRVVSWAVYVLW